jgi:hypothetical protein
MEILVKPARWVRFRCECKTEFKVLVKTIGLAYFCPQCGTYQCPKAAERKEGGQ